MAVWDVFRVSRRAFIVGLSLGVLASIPVGGGSAQDAAPDPNFEADGVLLKGAAPPAGLAPTLADAPVQPASATGLRITQFMLASQMAFGRSADDFVLDYMVASYLGSDDPGVRQALFAVADDYQGFRWYATYAKGTDDIEEFARITLAWPASSE